MRVARKELDRVDARHRRLCGVVETRNGGRMRWGGVLWMRGSLVSGSSVYCAPSHPRLNWRRKEITPVMLRNANFSNARAALPCPACRSRPLTSRARLPVIRALPRVRAAGRTIGPEPTVQRAAPIEKSAQGACAHPNQKQGTLSTHGRTELN